MSKKFKMASFFAGVGGIDLGFEETGKVETVYANEVDSYPVKTFELNFPIKVDRRDIQEVDPKDVPDIDICAGGFPCQPFSIEGYRKGFKDPKGRGTLFFELMRIIANKKPRVVFFENVKNLVGHDNGNTFRVILDALKQEGYHYHHQVLNAMSFGNTPQNRERIYIVGFRDEEQFKKFTFPEPIPLTTRLDDIIDYRTKVDDKYYYTPDKHKSNICNLLFQEMTDPTTVYQWRRGHVRKNKKNVIPTLTAGMGGGGNNVPLVLAEHGIRKLTPRECFNA